MYIYIYHTPQPCSAAVGKMLSSAGNILRAKQYSLIASNFEEFVFMRVNMELLEFKEEEDRL